MVAPVPTALIKPRMRGVLHQWAFFVSLLLGLLLVLAASGEREVAATAIYAASVAMRRADHAMIFVLIAGTYTPFALLVMEGPLATAILVAVWSGAAAGIILQLAWIDASRWLSVVVYMVLGWVALATVPDLLEGIGLTATLLLATGGLLYTVGALVYALRRPDPAPTVFGYHEIFHALVVAAAALQYAVIAFWVV